MEDIYIGLKSSDKNILLESGVEFNSDEFTLNTTPIYKHKILSQVVRKLQGEIPVFGQYMEK